MAIVSAKRKPGSPRTFESRIYSDPSGKTLPYRLLKPRNYNPGQRYPLFLFLHGAGERGDDNRAQLKHCFGLFSESRVRKRFPCFVVVPQCPMTDEKSGAPWGWTGVHSLKVKPYRLPEKIGDAERLALEIVAALQKEFSIDAKRLYIGGISMGGFATWDVLARFPAMFAAAVIVCGGGDTQTAARFTKIPIWNFHGVKDAIVPVQMSRRMIAALKKSGGKPHFTEYPEAKHDSWTPAFSEPELLPWLFGQRRD
jgi:predicted peptidase